MEKLDAWFCDVLIVLDNISCQNNKDRKSAAFWCFFIVKHSFL